MDDDVDVAMAAAATDLGLSAGTLSLMAIVQSPPLFGDKTHLSHAGGVRKSHNAGVVAHAASPRPLELEARKIFGRAKHMFPDLDGDACRAAIPATNRSLAAQVRQMPRRYLWRAMAML
jgi:hypothetical protein